MRIHSILSILLLISASFSYAQVVIKGKIHNYDGESVISYYPTLDGIYSPRFLTVKPKPNGSFKIKFENEGFGTMDFSYKRLIYRFFYDSDSKIYLEIDQNKINFNRRPSYPDRDSVKQVATISLRGNFQEVNHFYNSNVRTSHMSAISNNSLYAKMIASLEEPKEALHVMDSLIHREIDEINALEFKINNENVQKDDREEVKQFLINEVKAFYTSIFFSAMSRKRANQRKALKEDPNASLSIYNDEWIHFQEQIILASQKEIKAAPNSKDYNDYLRYLFYLVYSESYKTHEVVDDNKSLDERTILILLESDSLIALEKKSLEALKLHDFSKYLTNQLFYSPALLDAVYEFKRRYPESTHIENLQPYVDKLENYIVESSKEYNKARVIETNYTTFSDLIEEFKGQYILLDIWATWCHPCVEDFKHKDTIEEYMQDKNIITLYISIDPPKWEDRWRNSIKYNQLDGYHVRPNREFITDMWDVIGGYRGSIPRYVLINDKGKVFKASAARPSQDNQLISQIEELINGE